MQAAPRAMTEQPLMTASDAIQARRVGQKRIRASWAMSTVFSLALSAPVTVNSRLSISVFNVVSNAALASP